MSELGELERVVVEIIAKRKKLDAAAVRLDSSFRDLGIDSLDGIDLVFAFEDKYNINIPDHLVQQMSSVRDVVNTLRQELDNRPQPAA